MNDQDSKQNIEEAKMETNDFKEAGTGSCTLCDCPSFIPSAGGSTCINHNTAGGTCNHYDSEHN